MRDARTLADYFETAPPSNSRQLDGLVGHTAQVGGMSPVFDWFWLVGSVNRSALQKLGGRPLRKTTKGRARLIAEAEMESLIRVQVVPPGSAHVVDCGNTCGWWSVFDYSRCLRGILGGFNGWKMKAFRRGVGKFKVLQKANRIGTVLRIFK